MPTRIDADASVFTLINTFTVLAESQTAVVDELKRFTEQHARHLPGFVGAAVHASRVGTRVVNYVQWRDAAALEAMLATTAAREHLATVAALSEHVDPVPYVVSFVKGEG